MESYIVRILRRSIHKSEEIMGFVEIPEFEQKEPFRNFREFINIFILPDLNKSQGRNKQVVEQRKHRRFQLQEGTIIFDTITDIGEICDISMGGLSFTSSDMVDDCPETVEVDILCGDKKNTIRNIKCRRISQDNPPEKVFLRYPETVRRFSLAFDTLSSLQKTQLENLIQNCTIMEI